MVQVLSKLKIVDNSSIKKIKCIKINHKPFFGCLFKAAVKITINRKNKKNFLKKGSLLFSLIVQLRFWVIRKDGQFIRFFKNSAIVTDQNAKMLFTRTVVPICTEFRKKKYLKIISTSSFFI